jgi:hypothetical protein
MQMPDSYVGADDNRELPCGEEKTQAFEQILSNGLTTFYRRAYRLLGNAADAEDAVQDALLAAFLRLTPRKARKRVVSGGNSRPLCAGHFSCALLKVCRSRKLRESWEYPPAL